MAGAQGSPSGAAPCSRRKCPSSCSAHLLPSHQVLPRRHDLSLRCVHAAPASPAAAAHGLRGRVHALQGLGVILEVQRDLAEQFVYFQVSGQPPAALKVARCKISRHLLPQRSNHTLEPSSACCSWHLSTLPRACCCSAPACPACCRSSIFADSHRWQQASACFTCSCAPYSGSTIVL